MPPKSLPKGKQGDLARRRATKIRGQAKGKTGRGLQGKAGAKDGDDMTDLGDTEGDDWMHSKTLVKPEDQLDLSEQELKEEFTRILTANNPHAPQNIVRYSFKEKQYKQTSHVDQLAIHFALDGNMIHKESDEANRQRQKLGIPEAQSEVAGSEVGEPAAAAAAEGEEAKEEGKEEGRDEATTPAPAGKTDKQKLTNQFNFSERASQTYNNPHRERSTATEPPPRATFAGNVTQWEIFDAYKEDFEKQSEALRAKQMSKTPSNYLHGHQHHHQQEKSKEKKTIPGRKEEEKTRKKLAITETQGDDICKIARACKIVERMVNQNTYDDIAQDFKYYEDQSDDYRDNEGTMLPLWKFSHEKAKKLAVTSLCWNPEYRDLFAASFGSYDFMKQGNGMVLFYTLKNPSYPEYIYEADSGIMCLDLHPKHSNLVAIGFYDGSVGLFDVHKKELVHRCTAKNGKHTDPVWQVRWQKDDLENNRNFFSVSSDGRIVKWTIVKNEMTFEEIITLTLNDSQGAGPDGTTINTYGCGTAFDFHRKKEYLFLVGTEEGKIHSCSKAYSSQFLDTVDSHNMAVYNVRWNPFHPDVYITCSADWTVKIWEVGSQTGDKAEGSNADSPAKKPLFTFDLNNSVGDVAWAPYSSTSFAAVTADGKIFVYDLNVNKYEPLCEQMIAQKKKTKLTHIEFNPKDPIVIVGDDRGNVTSLKISPNLRKVPKEKKGAQAVDPATKELNEKAKLDKILAMVRESSDDKK